MNWLVLAVFLIALKDPVTIRKCKILTELGKEKNWLIGKYPNRRMIKPRNLQSFNCIENHKTSTSMFDESPSWIYTLKHKWWRSIQRLFYIYWYWLLLTNLALDRNIKNHEFNFSSKLIPLSQQMRTKNQRNMINNLHGF